VFYCAVHPVVLCFIVLYIRLYWVLLCCTSGCIVFYCIVHLVVLCFIVLYIRLCCVLLYCTLVVLCFLVLYIRLYCVLLYCTSCCIVFYCIVHPVYCVLLYCTSACIVNIPGINHSAHILKFSPPPHTHTHTPSTALLFTLHLLHPHSSKTDFRLNLPEGQAGITKGLQQFSVPLFN